MLITLNHSLEEKDIFTSSDYFKSFYLKRQNRKIVIHPLHNISFFVNVTYLLTFKSKIVYFVIKHTTLNFKDNLNKLINLIIED